MVDRIKYNRKNLVRRSARISLYIIMLLGFYLRFSAANHPYISLWDEAYHAVVAKNMLSNPLKPVLYKNPVLEYDFKDWTNNHIWLHKPPVTFWLMALSIYISGDEEIIFRMPSIILSTLSIFVTFFCGRHLVGIIPALIASFFQSINPLYIRLVSGTIPVDHVDVVFSFFVQITFFSFVTAGRKNSHFLFLLSGILLGLGYLTKSLPIFVSFAATIPILWNGKQFIKPMIKNLLYSLLGFILIAMPWNIYTKMMWPAEYTYEKNYTLMHIFKAVEGHDHPIQYYWYLIRDHFGTSANIYTTYLIIVGSLLYAMFTLIYKSNLKNETTTTDHVNKKKQLLALLLWALIPYAVFSLTATKMYSYIAPSVPAILLLVGYSIYSLFTLWNKPFIYGKIISVGCLGIILYFSVSLLVERTTADYSVPPWRYIYDHKDFRHKMKIIDQLPTKKIILNVGEQRYIDCMYYADCSAYPSLISYEMIKNFLKLGYEIYLFIDHRKDRLQEIKNLINWNNGELKNKIKLIYIKPSKYLKENVLPDKRPPYQN